MSGKDDSCRRQRRIGEAAKTLFLAALRRGERREDAAAAAGFSLMGFYGARSRDPAFRAEWTQALAASAAAERRVRAYATRGACPEQSRGEVRIASANRRFYQRRRRRNVRFTAERQAVFLTHFAATCDTRASAAAAGVSESTIHLHRRTDPAFAEAYGQALAEGSVRLEAEVLRQRLAAQPRLRAAIEAAWENPPRNGEGDHAQHGGGVAPTGRRHDACPACGLAADAGAEFDRIMKLLARHDRKPRRPERGFKPGGRRQRWTFDEAIVLLDKKLRAMGARTAPPPQDKAQD